MTCALIFIPAEVELVGVLNICTEICVCVESQLYQIMWKMSDNKVGNQALP